MGRWDGGDRTRWLITQQETDQFLTEWKIYFENAEEKQSTSYSVSLTYRFWSRVLRFCVAIVEKRSFTLDFEFFAFVCSRSLNLSRKCKRWASRYTKCGVPKAAEWGVYTFFETEQKSKTRLRLKRQVKKKKKNRIESWDNLFSNWTQLEKHFSGCQGCKFECHRWTDVIWRWNRIVKKYR